MFQVGTIKIKYMPKRAKNPLKHLSIDEFG